MEISVDKLLHKMEEKLKEAKETGSDAVIRERIHAIKTMCELILEEPSTTNTTVSQSSNLQVAKPIYTGQGSSLPNQPQRLIIDEESNGESIFDF
ncbi:YwdI family protein [Niallia sp. XMNu-256]|uniref:YwdI family protein n=1 Tax=Niallia sp. XMNu-256 TaxID=3082444 RepID=UPI0030D1EB71